MNDLEDDWLHDTSSSSDPVRPGGSSDPMVQQTWNRLTTRFNDVGYREGISEGKLSSLQEGFDQEFEKSVPLVRRLGRLRGAVNGLVGYLNVTLAAMDSSSDDSARTQALLEETRRMSSLLGKIKMRDILPADQEAIEHAKEHEFNEHEDEPREKGVMDDLLDAMDGMGSDKRKEQQEGDVLLSQLEFKVEEMASAAGISGILTRH